MAAKGSHNAEEKEQRDSLRRAMAPLDNQVETEAEKVTEGEHAAAKDEIPTATTTPSAVPSDDASTTRVRVVKPPSLADADRVGDAGRLVEEDGDDAEGEGGPLQPRLLPPSQPPLAGIDDPEQRALIAALLRDVERSAHKGLSAAEAAEARYSEALDANALVFAAVPERLRVNMQQRAADLSTAEREGEEELSPNANPQPGDYPDPNGERSPFSTRGRNGGNSHRRAKSEKRRRRDAMRPALYGDNSNNNPSLDACCAFYTSYDQIAPHTFDPRRWGRDTYWRESPLMKGRRPPALLVPPSARRVRFAAIADDNRGTMPDFGAAMGADQQPGVLGAEGAIATMKDAPPR